MLCKAYGPPESLVWEEVEPPVLDDDGVRIRVRAAGVNFPDLLIIEGKYQFKPDMPFAPGAEVAGEVVEVGAAVTRFAAGDRVIGMTRWNGYAEEAVVPEERCLGLPAGMSFETGAGFPMTYGTSFHALVQRGRLQAGETLLVHGASGGVGTAAVEIGGCLGARVIASGGSDDKLRAVAERYAVADVVNYRTDPAWKDRVKALTGGAGADVIYDPGRRRGLRAVAALRQLGRPAPRGGLRGRRHSQRARQPRAPQGLSDRRGLLGRLRAARPRGEPRQLRPALRVVRGGPPAAARVAHAASRTGAGGHAHARPPRGRRQDRADDLIRPPGRTCYRAGSGRAKTYSVFVAPGTRPPPTGTAKYCRPSTA